MLQSTARGCDFRSKFAFGRMAKKPGVTAPDLIEPNHPASVRLGTRWGMAFGKWPQTAFRRSLPFRFPSLNRGVFLKASIQEASELPSDDTTSSGQVAFGFPKTTAARLTETPAPAWWLP